MTPSEAAKRLIYIEKTGSGERFVSQIFGKTVNCFGILKYKTTPTER
jgi:hypothetical protein